MKGRWFEQFNFYTATASCALIVWTHAHAKPWACTYGEIPLIVKPRPECCQSQKQDNICQSDDHCPVATCSTHDNHRMQRSRCRPDTQVDVDSTFTWSGQRRRQKRAWLAQSPATSPASFDLSIAIPGQDYRAAVPIKFIQSVTGGRPARKAMPPVPIGTTTAA